MLEAIGRRAILLLQLCRVLLCTSQLLIQLLTVRDHVLLLCGNQLLLTCLRETLLLPVCLQLVGPLLVGLLLARLQLFGPLLVRLLLLCL